MGKPHPYRGSMVRSFRLSPCLAVAQALLTHRRLPCGGGHGAYSGRGAVQVPAPLGEDGDTVQGHAAARFCHKHVLFRPHHMHRASCLDVSGLMDHGCRSRGFAVLSQSELAPLLLFKLLSPRTPSGKPVGESLSDLLRAIVDWPRAGCHVLLKAANGDVDDACEGSAAIGTGPIATCALPCIVLTMCPSADIGLQ